jgi:ABC-type uncharacterized transport system permease subunit
MLNELNKYWAFALVNFKRLNLYKMDLVLDMLSISLRMILPYSIFWALAQQGNISLETANSLVWAIFIGQILNKSGSKTHMAIRKDIRSGSIVTELTLPVNYIWSKAFDHLANFVLKFSLYFTLLAPVLYFLAPSKVNLLLILPFSLLATLILLGFDLSLGLSSFLIEENEGIYYIVSKLFFLFGNQVVPIALMPIWISSWVKFTPFYLGLAAPSEIARGSFEPGTAIITYVIYLALFALIINWLYKKLQTQVLLNGG